MLSNPGAGVLLFNTKQLIPQLAGAVRAEKLVFHHQHEAIFWIEVEDDNVTVAISTFRSFRTSREIELPEARGVSQPQIRRSLAWSGCC